jgi:hypothetical protein
MFEEDFELNAHHCSMAGRSGLATTPQRRFNALCEASNQRGPLVVVAYSRHGILQECWLNMQDEWEIPVSRGWRDVPELLAQKA